jgi:hypothetical protein
MDHASCNDTPVKIIAFDVMEEACQDEDSLNFLLNKT